MSRFYDVLHRLGEINRRVMSKQMSDEGWDLRDEMVELIDAVKELASVSMDKISERGVQ